MPDRPTPEERVRPFANGFECDAWTGRNCVGCAKYDPENANQDNCEIDYAVGAAYIGDGTIPHMIAQRMGFFDEGQKGLVLAWSCPEREEKADA